MPAQVVHLPFVRGQHEEIDRKLLPNGMLYAVENYRFRKDGRLGRRWGTQALPRVDNAGATLSGTVQALREFKGLLTMVHDSRVYQFDDDKDYWTKKTLIPRFVAHPSRVISHSIGESWTRSAVAVVNGYLCYAWSEETELWFAVYTVDGAHVFTSQLESANATDPRMVVVGTKVFLYYIDTTGSPATLRVRQMDTSGSTLTSNSVGVAQTTAEWSADVIAASSYDVSVMGTSILVAFEDDGAGGVTAFLVDSTVDGRTVTASASVSETGEAAIIGTTGENIYLAWRNGSNVRYRAYSTSLGAATATFTLDTSANNTGRPCITRANATAATFYWNTGFTDAFGTTISQIEWRTGSNAGALGTASLQSDCRMASKPWVGTSGTYGWVFEGQSGQTRSYHVISYTDAASSSVRQHQVTVARELASDVSAELVQETALDADGRRHFAAPHIVRGLVDGSSSNFGISDFVVEETLAQRQCVEFGGSLYIAGGHLMSFDGAAVSESGWHYRPVITDVTSAGAGSIAAGTYSYVAVLEIVDFAGRRQLGSVSDPVSITLAGSENVNVDVKIVQLTSRDDSVGNGEEEAFITLYRTLAGGTVYQKVTPDTPGAGTLGPFPNRPSSTSGITRFIDNTTDATLAAREFLYTEGNVLEDVPPPPCRYVARGKSRLWIAGLPEDPRAAQCSKLFIRGEPARFVDHEAFKVRASEDLTAIWTLDEALVMFSADSIWVAFGDGPDDGGIGAFSEPRRISSDIGCTDWRSLVETPEGLMFQSRRGIFILPRGFGAPTWIGRPVRDLLASYPYVTSATLVPTDNTVRFAIGDSSTAPTAGRVLVYDLQTREWMRDSYDSYAPMHMATLGGNAVFSKAQLSDANALRRESPAIFSDVLGEYDSYVETGDIRLAGINGYQRIVAAVVLAEYRASSTLQIFAGYDDDDVDSFPDSGSWTLSLFSIGDVIQREYGLPWQKCGLVRFRICDINSVTEGQALSGLSLKVITKQGTRRLRSSDRE